MWQYGFKHDRPLEKIVEGYYEDVSLGAFRFLGRRPGIFDFGTTGSPEQSTAYVVGRRNLCRVSRWVFLDALHVNPARETPASDGAFGVHPLYILVVLLRMSSPWKTLEE